MIAIVGGGAIGLACAWRLAQTGADVTVFERGQIGREASFAAGGMLAPRAEFWMHNADNPNGAAMLEISRQSLALYPAFARELLELTGVDIELCQRDSPTHDWREPGILMVGGPCFDAGREWNGRGAKWLAGEGQVEPRALTRALRLACEKAGVCLRENAPVGGIARGGNWLTHLLVGDEKIAVAQVVLCAGAWSGALPGLSPAELPPVRPVAGQMLQLRGERRLKHIVYGEHCYLIPRRDGRLLVGATEEETGFDKRVTAAGTSQLLNAALQLAPVLEDATLETSWAGLRPVAPDGLPILGRGPIENLVYATGHGRNGILLTPHTAEIVARGEAVPEAFGPERFAACATGT